MQWFIIYNIEDGRCVFASEVETKIFFGTPGASLEDTIKRFHNEIEFADPRSLLNNEDRTRYTIQFSICCSDWIIGAEGLDDGWYEKEKRKRSDPEWYKYLKLKEKFEPKIQN
jgi:hypothetical protein